MLVVFFAFSRGAAPGAIHAAVPESVERGLKADCAIVSNRSNRIDDRISHNIQRLNVGRSELVAELQQLWRGCALMKRCIGPHCCYRLAQRRSLLVSAPMGARIGAIAT